MKTRYTFYLLLTTALCLAQKHDHIWQLGYNSQFMSPDFGGTEINFNTYPPSIYSITRPMNFDYTNTSICDSLGNLLFYTNGIYIAGSSYQPLENGTGLNPGIVADGWGQTGYPLEQGGVFIPDPGDNKLFYLLHSKLELLTNAFPSNHISTLYYSLINKEEGNYGKVDLKNQVVILDTLEGGKLTSAKHANGRDWWLLIPEFDHYCYYRVLISPEGVFNQGKQCVDPVDGYGQPSIGQAVFSPDGSKYIRHDLRGFPAGHFVKIYDFDRCTGLLSNHRHIPLADTAGIGGCAVSPNSRFLYVSSQTVLYQFDLWAEDIEASKTVVAVYDGFVSFTQTYFRTAQLAPDGKIYVNCAGGHKVWHVIHQPNLPGAACRVEQHALELPTYNFRSMPNFPNYRLGPVDGSACDTLGINNNPLAGWRHEVQAQEVFFTDVSWYEPTDWHWTFGDGGSSTERDPVHVYAASGVYEVCLIVSNANASDTLCRELEIIITDTQEPLAHKPLLKIFPNPAKDYMVLQVVGSEALLRLGALVKLEWVLYDAFGRELRSIQLQHPEAQTIINLESLLAGMYFWRLEVGGEVLEQGKLSVL